MIVALSRFRAEQGAGRPLVEVHPDRADLLSRAPGFLGAETFRCGTDDTKILSMTRWADEASFRQWISSDLWSAWSTQSFPGMTLDPELPEPVVLVRIEEPALDQEIADARLLLTRFITDAQSLYFLRADARGIVRSCNGAWSELLGLPAEQLVGQAFWDWLTGRDAEQLRDRVRDGLRRPQERFFLNVCNAEHTPHTLECHLDVRPDGFTLLAEPPHSADRRLQKELVALNRELTLVARERGRAQARAEAAEQERAELLGREHEARLAAEQASRTKDAFLGMVSHELRNPLSAIQYWAELLGMGKLDEARTRRAVETILRNVRVQIRLVEDLLDATRITSGTLRVNPRPIDPVAVLDAAVEAVRPAAEGKRIQLEKSVDGSAVLFQADAPRLEQALVNLLGNAVKFTPERGRVEVRLEVSAAEVRFRVADTGPGIDPGLLPKLFEPFRQGAFGEERSSGLGLGLAISQRIAQLHGGEIAVESPGLGQGAVFTVRLPRPA